MTLRIRASSRLWHVPTTIGLSLIVMARPLDCQPVPLGRAVSCSSCQITTDTVTVLKDEMVGRGSFVTRDRAGRLYVFTAGEGRISIYDAAGRLQRTVGRRGAGPGEFEGLRNVVVRDDGTLFAIDATLGRLSVFGPDGRYLRSAPVPPLRGFGLPAISLPNGEILVNVRTATPGAPVDTRTPEVVAALQRVDSLGHVTALNDVAGPARRPAWTDSRILALTPDSELLVGQPYTASLQLFAANLTRRRTIAFRVPWKLPQATDPEPSDGIFDRPYTARLVNVWRDVDQRWWVHYAVPAAAWKPGPASRELAKLTADAQEALVRRPRTEHVLEVFSRDLATTLARARYSVPLGLPVADGYYARSSDTAAGEPSVQVLLFHLKPGR